VTKSASGSCGRLASNGRDSRKVLNFSSVVPSAVVTQGGCRVTEQNLLFTSLGSSAVCGGGEYALGGRVDGQLRRDGHLRGENRRPLIVLLQDNVGHNGCGTSSQDNVESLLIPPPRILEQLL